MEQQNISEKKILEAAREVFLRKGFDGARMQDIADEAGINKSLLHYYFRSKDKLFEAIFRKAFEEFIPKIAEALSSDNTVFEKIEIFVNSYINMLRNNPYLPLFILGELHRNPGKIVDMIKNQGAKPEMFFYSLQKEIMEGKIKPVDPRHLIVNMLAMCLFPFIGRPIIQGFLFNNDKESYDVFLEERKVEIPKFIYNSIEIKK
jgi:TetR/AcrR family transcriptional regulator